MTELKQLKRFVATPVKNLLFVVNIYIHMGAIYINKIGHIKKKPQFKQNRKTVIVL